MVALGILIAIAAQFLPTTVSSEVSVLSGLPTSVVNIGLLQRQMMLFQAGLALFLGGSVFFAVGSMCGVSANRVPSEPKSVAPASSFDARQADKLLLWGVGSLVVGVIVLLALASLLASPHS